MNDLSLCDPVVASASIDGSVILSDMRKWGRVTTAGGRKKMKQSSVRRLFPTKERSVVNCCAVSPAGYVICGTTDGPL